MQNPEIYDIVIFQNFFVYTGYNCKNKEKYQYIISNWKNDFKELLLHLANRNTIYIGFNINNFAYYFIHHLINNRELYIYFSGDEIVRELYKLLEKILSSTDIEFIKDNEKYIKQIDLAKIWNFDTKDRKISLDDIKFYFKNKNIKYKPFKHYKWCSKEDESTILEYSDNNINTIYELLLITLGKTENDLYKNKNKIQIRIDLQRQFKVNCLNLSSSRIGEQLLLYLYSGITKQSISVIRKQGTNRDCIYLKDCIPYWNNIKSITFNKYINKLNETKILLPSNDNEFNFSLTYNNFKWNYTLGACRGCNTHGIYQSDDNNIILDIDVNSLFPCIVKSLNAHPAHLTDDFNTIYTKLIDIRLSEKNKPIDQQNEELIEIFKKALNAAIGKSNEEKSFLYDPLFSYKIRIAGQVFMSMWSENLIAKIPNIKFLSVNTDGLTVYVSKEYINTVFDICNQFTSLIGLTFKYEIYKTLFLKDVNNYLAITDSGKIKDKGAFEVNKEIYKDTSMRIVPLAVKNYFINNIPIEQTIKNHTNIFDFCVKIKSHNNSNILFKHFDKSNNIIDVDLSHMTRCYIGNGIKSGTLFETTANTLSRLLPGFSVIIFNDYFECLNFNDYHIDYNFYIHEAYKLKNSIDDGQLTLF